jgi:hypothetical protein
VGGPWSFRFGLQFIPPTGVDARIRQRHLVRLSQPAPNLVIASKAVRGLELFVQGRQGCRGDALPQGRPRDLLVQHVIKPTRGVGIQPGGHTGAMDAEEGRDCLAVVGTPARGQIKGLQALALLRVLCLFHALVQGVGALGNRRHLFTHRGYPPAHVQGL